MQLCRYDDDRIGRVRDGRVYEVSDALRHLPSFRWPLPAHDVLIEHLAEMTTAIERLPLSGIGVPLESVSLQSPVAHVPKVIAAPVNYQAHFDEAVAHFAAAGKELLPIGDAGLFLKAGSSVVGPGEGIRLHFPQRRTDHEIELVVVIGKTCKDVDEAQALDVVAGYCIGLDISVRGSEDRSFRKSPDGYTVLGPYLTTRDDVPDVGALDVELRVNGVVRQTSNTADLIYGIPKLIAWASSWYTLVPGDVIFTGTPSGIDRLVSGDVLEASIDRLGTMRVHVA